MDVKIDSLIPFDKLVTDVDSVFAIADKNDTVVLLKDNKPAYIIIKYDAYQGLGVNAFLYGGTTNTLQEAMRIVLLETEENTMHASKLADEIYNRKLYFQKNGSKAQYTQVRSRCGHYPEMFEAIPGNFIKLKDIWVRQKS